METTPLPTPLPAPAKVPVNILMVDDQPGKLLTYESILAELGENLIRANSGNEALETLLRSEIAVVLVDVCMPELDGFELAEMIRRHPRFQKTAVILVSGILVGDTDRLRGYTSGALDYVSVPIVPEILRAKVAVFADWYRKSCELERLNQELEGRVAVRTAEIELARRESERANRLKDEFLATLSHELRTPLNAITGWAHLLLTGGMAAADQLEAVAIIHRNAMAQARLISDLLDVSRIVSGKVRLDLQPTDPAAVVRASLDSIRPAAAARNVHIAVSIEVAATVAADPARLQQVVANLLSNAVKFAPEQGTVAVQLRVSRIEGAPAVELTVEDDGPGIPPELLPHIFERFIQSDTSSTRAHQGLGLGLTIVRHLVDLHGGRVAASNRADRSGARLSVLLPARLAAAPSAPEALPLPAPPRSLSGRRLLVVDDEADARQVIARLLTHSGAEVAAAASVEAALQALDAGPRLPDAIVSDIEMPREDGYSLVRRLRARSAARGGRIPVVALTAYAGAQDRERLLAAGFCQHVPKPVDAPELIAAVAAVARPARAPNKRSSRARAVHGTGG